MIRSAFNWRFLVIPAFLAAAGCSLFHVTPVGPTEVRTAGPFENKLGEPFGVALKDGELYVSDGQKGVVWKIDPENRMSEFAVGFSTPSHIDFDSEGNLYVADSGDHTVKKVTADGSVELVAGVPGNRGYRDGAAKNALFNAPVGIAVQGDRLLIADTYNDRIRVIEDGVVRTLCGGGQGLADGPNGMFDTPTGIAVAEDTVLVADTGNRRIRVVAGDGAVSTLAGGGFRESGGLLADASFRSPVDIAVGPGKTIYVADGDRIRAIGGRYVPIVETISGSGRGFRDGALRSGLFNRVSGLAVARNGDIYAADSDNSVVRVLTGNGTGLQITRENFEKHLVTMSRFRNDGPARWPYKQARRTREIAGTLGEIRGEIDESVSEAWFHNGLDITGGYGETATVIRDEKVLLPISVSEFGTRRENVRFPQIGYVHLNLGRDVDGQPYRDGRFQFRIDSGGMAAGLRIPRGSSFSAGDPLGTLNSMNHVHLITGFRGREFNSLGAVKLPGASDSRLPVIESVDLYGADWVPFETLGSDIRATPGKLARLVVTAYDQMDGNADRRRLGVYKLGYELLNADGTSLRGAAAPKWTLQFQRTPPHKAVKLVYAPGSRSGATGKTVFNYIVSNEVDGDFYRESFLRLPDKPGTFILRIFAADFFGNTASKDIRLTIAKEF